MECGEQCVLVAGIKMMPELCADNWDTMWTQVKVSLFIHLEGDVASSRMLHVRYSCFVVCGKILLPYLGYMHLPIHRLDLHCVILTWITVMPELCVGNTGRDN